MFAAVANVLSDTSHSQSVNQSINHWYTFT